MIDTADISFPQMFLLVLAYLIVDMVCIKLPFMIIVHLLLKGCICPIYDETISYILP